MKKLFIVINLFVIVIMASGQDSPKWDIKYHNAVVLSSSDHRFQFKLGGRIQFDVMNINQNDSLDEHFLAQNGAEFRRLRWYTSGTLFSNIKFKLQFDFSRGDAGVKDAYIEVTKIPAIGHFRVGHFKQPFGFELLTSSKYVPFMERSLTDIFTPERDLGFMIYNYQFNKRFAWYAGYFYPSGNIGLYTGDQYRFTFRIAGQPIYKTENRYIVLHLGLAYVNQYHNNEQLELDERPESHLAPKYIKLVIDAVKRAHVFGSELAFVRGPLAFQGEFILTYVNPASYSVALEDNYQFKAYYGTISWFITGEHKNYSQSYTAMDRVNPKKNLGNGGFGAVELTFRYSYVDLTDKDLKGGEMGDITAGLNWYLNPATRFTFNYIYSDVKTLGKANIYQARLQVAF